MDIECNSIVTVDLKNNDVSNTYLVDQIINESEALLFHPLYPTILLKRKLSELNVVASNIKDSTERSLDFAKRQKSLLDVNMICDLDALCMYFVVTRRLTKKQKFVLSTVCGFLAKQQFESNIDQTMKFIVSNEALLDEFNRLWYNNFNDIFNGKRSITSKKQSDAIFNIAGFLLAELHGPTVLK